MLISHSHQFIYLKTRKTAGTSVEMALQPWAAPKFDAPVVEPVHARISPNGVIGRRVFEGEDRTPADKVWFNHMTADQVRARVAPAIWSRYLKLTVLRNPFDRMVSYFHWQMTLFPINRGQLPTLEATADDFADIREKFQEFIRDEKWNTDELVTHSNGQWCIDAIIRYEVLNDDILAFADRAGLDKAHIKLPHTKAGGSLRKGHALDDYYSPACIDIVRRRLAWVFERGGYPDTPRAWDDRSRGLDAT